MFAASFSFILALAVLLFVAEASQISYKSPYPQDGVDRLAAVGLAKLAKYRATNHPRSNCTIASAIKRREWSDLSPKNRIAYTNAVLCLQQKPSITPASFAPGAKSRYDDFIVSHRPNFGASSPEVFNAYANRVRLTVNQTSSIHNTGNFLSWHRYFIHKYEKALRDECGYKGYSPYWNWGRYAADPVNSPLFDGSATSMGGNGAFSPYPGTLMPAVPAGMKNGMIPSAGGGGCVTTGPFKNMTANLGPLAVAVLGVPRNTHPLGLDHNPRCLRRDVNHYASAVTADNYTTSLLTKPQNKDLLSFQDDMQGRMELGEWGVHAAGHFTIGGDPGGDIFSSPGDPVFYLHHAQVDRVWWIWQMHNLPHSLKAVAGTTTRRNNPPGRNTTLDDLQDLGLNGKPVRLGNLLDTMSGDFCYIYV